MNIPALILAASLLSIPGSQPPEATQRAPLSHEEMVELIDLMAAERADLYRKIALLEAENAVLRVAITKSEEAEASYSRLLEVTRETCEAQVKAAELSCDCPSPLLRKVNLGLALTLGGLAGRGTCD